MECAAKILLLGKTKAGKSSFINYFLGKNVAKAGPGAPITSEYFVPYEASGGKYPLYIYDTKGLEALDANNQLEEIIAGIKKQNCSDDIYDWFHTIFYCVSVTERFQQFEADFLLRIRKELSQHVHIILTHCNACSEETIQHMRQRILDCLDNQTGIEIFKVVSVQKEKRNGEIVYPQGKEIIVERVFDLLLEDIANKLSLDYASTLTLAIYHDIFDVFDKLNNYVDKTINMSTFFRMIMNQDEFFDDLDVIVEDELSNLEHAIDEDKEQTDEEFRKILQSMTKLYTSYWDTVTDSDYLENARLDFDIFEWISTDWLDKLDAGTFLAKLFPRLAKRYDLNSDLPDDPPLSELLQIIGAGIGDMWSLKKNIKKFLQNIKTEIILSVPSEETIQREACQRIINYINIKPSLD